MTIKAITKEKAEALHIDMEMKGQAQFVSWVAKEEGISWDDAYLRCTASKGAEDAELRVGYKLADPFTQFDLWMHLGKKAKREAAERFASKLDEWELAKWQEVDQVGAAKLFRESLKKKEKSVKR